LPGPLVHDSTGNIGARPVALFRLQERKVSHHAAREENTDDGANQNGQGDQDHHDAGAIHSLVHFDLRTNDFPAKARAELPATIETTPVVKKVARGYRHRLM